MKIIKDGKWNNLWKMELTCKKCEAVLEVEESDLIPIWVGGNFREDVDHEIGYECPVCANINSVSRDLLYERVRTEIEKKRPR